MGLDYSTRLGPYVVCRVGKATRTKTVEACTDRECRLHAFPTGAAFCPRCGAAIGPVELNYEADAISAWDLMDAIRHALAPIHDHLGDCLPEGMHIWVANVRRDGDPSRSFSPREGTRLDDLTGLDVGRECDAFTHAFAPELAALRGAYGAENVSVRWGLIHECY